jgi:transcriptional regulator with XRE-family HTH domain
MGGRKRRPGRRRAEEQARRIGDEVVVARATLSWSRGQLASRANVARSTVERIEAGDPSVQLDVLCAVTGSAGLDLVLSAYPGRPAGLRDTGQMELAQRLISQAHGSWKHELEVLCGRHGESADLVLFGASSIIHVEIERSMIDFQAQYRRAVAKRQSLATGESRLVRLVLAVEDTRRNRAALVAHRGLIGRTLPAGSREVLASVRGGTPLQRDGLLWLRRAGR